MTQTPTTSLGTTRAWTWRSLATPEIVLAVVALIYAVATLPGAYLLRSLLWDEVVYASQLASGVHPVVWSAPRAWGMPLLLAPVDLLTTSSLVIRLYLSALAGIGLFLAFRPWLRVIDAWVVPVAAGLFATLWLSVLYGAMAYPNIWLAFAAVAGVGYVVRDLRTGSDRWALAGTVVTFAIASMLRPTDASAIAAPLLVVCLARRAWRPLAAISVGLTVGWAAWFGEAFVRFGGPIARLNSSAKVNDIHLGFHPLPMLQSLDGPALLCRPATLCTDVHRLEVAWLLVLPVLVVLGIIAARPRSPYLLAAASATCLALSYVLTIDWFSARFLLPAFGLLALPVGAALVAAVRWRTAMAVVMAIALVLHVGAQVRTYQRVLKPATATSGVMVKRAAGLHDELGLRTPCHIFGPGSVQLSFLTGCWPGSSASSVSLQDAAVLKALAAGEQAAVIVRSTTGEPPAAEGWSLGELPGDTNTYGYVSVP